MEICQIQPCGAQVVVKRRYKAKTKNQDARTPPTPKLGPNPRNRFESLQRGSRKVPLDGRDSEISAVASIHSSSQESFAMPKRRSVKEIPEAQSRRSNPVRMSKECLSMSSEGVKTQRNPNARPCSRSRAAGRPIVRPRVRTFLWSTRRAVRWRASCSPCATRKS